MQPYTDEKVQLLRVQLLEQIDQQSPDILQELPLDTAQQLHQELVLLAFVYHDIDWQEAALFQLQRFLPAEEIAFHQKHFQIFRSINEQLPWMGNFQELQQDNYKDFLALKDSYIQSIAQSRIFAEILLDLGRKLYKLFDLINEAQDCFASVLQYNDKQADAHYALARILEQKYQYQDAKQHYEQSLVGDPNNIYALLQLGILEAREFNNYERAIELFNQVTSLDPYMIEVYIQIAQAQYTLKCIPEARQYIDMALSINAYNEQALNLLGHIQWKEDGDSEAAIETFEKGLDHHLHGDSGLLLGSLGELYMVDKGDHERAKLYYEKALKAKIDQPQRLEECVQLLLNFYQDFDRVAQLYDYYFYEVKFDAHMHYQYAAFLVEYLHDHELAADHLSLSLEICPEDKQALQLLQRIEPYLEEYDEEEEDDEEDDDDDDFFGGGGAASDG